MRRWTYAQRMAAGFVGVVLVATAIAASTTFALRALSGEHPETDVLRQGLRLAQVERLRRAYSETVASQRGHALSGAAFFLADAQLARGQFLDTLRELQARPTTPSERRALDKVALAEARYQDAVARLTHARERGEQPRDDGTLYLEVAESRTLCQQALEKLVWLTRWRLDERAEHARRVERRVSGLVLAASALGLLVAAGLVAVLTRVGPWRREARSDRQRLRLLVEGVKDYALYLLDGQGRVASWNPGAERLHGWRAEEILGRSGALLYAPEVVGGGLLEDLKRAGREGRLESEGVRLHKDGARFWAESLLTPLDDAAGRIEGHVVLTRDISERKRAEATLRLFVEAERLFLSVKDPDAAVDGLPRLLVPALADGCLLVRVSPRGEVLPRTLAHVAADKEGLLRALMHGPALPLRERAGAPEPSRAGRSERFVELGPEVLRRLADGPEHLALLERLAACSLLTVPLRAGEQTLGMLALVSQRPERRFTPSDQVFMEELAGRAALALDNERLLREAQAALELIGVAAHDLGNPLQALQLLLGKLRRQASAPEPGNLYDGLTRALRHTQRLGRLLHNLLDLSRLSSGRLELELGEVDLGELTRETAARHAEQSEELGSPLVLEVEKTVGRWDRLRLERVLTNLLSNAFKYGKGHPITLRVEGGEGGARLIVKDGGPGIPPMRQRDIFERFTKAPPEGEAKDGFGLGLYIVRQLVEANGGQVRVESTWGEGATFIVELPWASGRREVDMDPARPGARPEGG